MQSCEHDLSRDCREIPEPKVVEIARDHVKSKFGVDFFAKYKVETIVTRRPSCNVDVAFRYTPSLPGGAFMVRINQMGTVYDFVEGI